MAKKVIPYLQGFEVKPYITMQKGNVMVTDRTAVMQPNQIQCESYG